MREERKVVDGSEAPRLEELSDEDLEAVAGGLCKYSNNGTYTSWWQANYHGWQQYTNSNWHSDPSCSG